MPLISMYERDNSRAAYRILASRAVEMLGTEQSDLDETERIPLINLARLLEHYRYDDFSDHTPPGILEGVSMRQRRVSAPEPLVGQRSRFEALRTSLDRARTTTFGDRPKEDVIQDLQAVLMYLANRSPEVHNVPVGRIRAAKRFFGVLAQGLGAESGDG